MIKKINWNLKFEIDSNQEQIFDLAFEGTLDNTLEAVIKYKKNNKKINSNLIYEIISPKKNKLTDLRKFLSNKNITSKINKIEEKNWVEFSNRLRSEIVIGKFKIFSYTSNDLIYTKSQLPISINFNNGFGTGQHSTTQGCLIAFDKINKNRKFKNILEIGTGSGILSIALKKLFNSTVTSTESDMQAYQASISNFEVNKIDKKISLFNQSSISNSNIIKNSPYDLIVANILANPIIKFSNQIHDISKKKTILILSGFNYGQHLRIINKYRYLGFIYIMHINLNNWITLILEKRKLI
ncbi:MAG: Ribosomal protein L11 methyltransferase [Alphaproteobacteria bacterium MarineAlpha2_Bin1]|nr:MAG: Ribosomal protein L11 methyltransferase [Alphaproteobacteria bacterium MarineAlpha2_Bin1]